MSAKCRNWVAVIYQENLYPNWLATLESMCISAFVSPLHGGDNEDVKPHYHIVLMYDGPTTYDNALQDFNALGRVKICKLVRSLVGTARYLCHLDNPMKQQFPDWKEQLLEFSGADYEYIIHQPKDSIVELCEIFNKIDVEGINCWTGFIDYCRFHNPQFLKRILANTATVVCVKEYINDVKRLKYYSRNNPSSYN